MICWNAKLIFRSHFFLFCFTQPESTKTKSIESEWPKLSLKTRVDIGHPGLCWVHLFNLLNRFIRFLLKISMILKKIVSKRNNKKIHFGLSKVPNNRVTRSRIKTWYRYFLPSFLGENIKYQGISRKPEIK